MLAAVLACGEGSVVSHGTAAALLGLWERPPADLDVIAPVQAGRKIDGIRRRYVPPPSPGDALIHEGVPCTNPSRTIVDLASAFGERSLLSAVEQAAVLHLLDVSAIDAVLTGHRRRGSRLLRRILEDWRPLPAAPRVRSPLEAKLLPLIVSRGLPTPLINHKMTIVGRTLEVDCLWPEQRVVVEADGRKFHDNPAAFERDRRRDRNLQVAGYRVLRITWAQVDQEPEATLTAIRRLLGL